MCCLELSRLESIATLARVQLLAPAAEPQSPREAPLSLWDVEVRRAAFNADLDVLFHRAACPDCKAVRLKQAPIPGDYSKVA